MNAKQYWVVRSVGSYNEWEDVYAQVIKSVDELIAKGWQPLGGVSISAFDSGVNYSDTHLACAQAMVLPE